MGGKTREGERKAGGKMGRFEKKEEEKGREEESL